MGRPQRLDQGGYVYHVLNRANARRPLFRKDRDYLAFARILAEALEHVPGLRLLAYGLMPNTNKALKVKRRYFPRPRGAAFFWTPCLGGAAAVVRTRPWRPGFTIGSKRDSGPRRPQTSRTQHSCGLRRPRSAE